MFKNITGRDVTPEEIAEAKRERPPSVSCFRAKLYHATTGNLTVEAEAHFGHRAGLALVPCLINLTVSQLSKEATMFLRPRTRTGNSSDYEAVSGSTAVLPNFAFRFGFSRLFELPTLGSLP